MKFDFLHKQASRREMLQGSATLAGSTFLAHLFPATLLRGSAMDNAQRSVFAGSPAREHARQVQCRGHRNAKTR